MPEKDPTSPTLIATPLTTDRLELEPLRLGHAADAARAFADERLHTVTGGSPGEEDELRERYARQLVGHSPDRSASWLNWMVRRRDTDQLVGTVQATARPDGAALAWVVAVPHQGQGFAGEAAQAVCEWLRTCGVVRFTADIRPGHTPSERIATALGMARTTTVVDGEQRWSGG